MTNEINGLDSVDELESTIWTFQDIVRGAADGIITQDEFLRIIDYVRAREKKKARRAAQTKWMRENRRKITKS